MTQLGYFGKTIHRGDFVRFNLPKSFFTVMDDWLQSTMTQGDAKHGEEWPSRYQNASGYRFQLSSNVAGESGWFGVLAPSTDKVGRRFPFCIAASLPDQNIAPWGQPAFDEAFAAMESLLLRIREDDYDFGAAQDDIGTLASTITVALTQTATRTLELPAVGNTDTFSVMASSPDVIRTTSGALALLDALLTQAYFNYSIWTPLGGNSTGHVLLTSGLPDEHQALALFDADWSESMSGKIDLSGVVAAAVVQEPEETTAKMEPNEENTETPDDSVADAAAWTELENSTSTPADPPVAEIGTSVDTPAQTDTQTTDVVEDDDSITTPMPKIEPLELDDDSTTTAPWD